MGQIAKDFRIPASMLKNRNEIKKLFEHEKRDAKINRMARYLNLEKFLINSFNSAEIVMSLLEVM